MYAPRLDTRFHRIRCPTHPFASTRAAWVEPRVPLARLADVMLPYRQFAPPPAVSEEALAGIMEQLEDDDREYPD